MEQDKLKAEEDEKERAKSAKRTRSKSPKKVLICTAVKGTILLEIFHYVLKRGKFSTMF